MRILGLNFGNLVAASKAAIITRMDAKAKAQAEAAEKTAQAEAKANFTLRVADQALSNVKELNAEALRKTGVPSLLVDGTLTAAGESALETQKGLVAAALLRELGNRLLTEKAGFFSLSRWFGFSLQDQYTAGKAAFDADARVLAIPFVARPEGK